MRTDNQNQFAIYKEFEVQFRKLMGLRISENGFIFGFIGICIGIVFIGFFVGFIFMGLLLGLVILAPVYEPVYYLTRKALQLKGAPFYFVKPPLSKFLIACLSLVIPGYIVVVGIRGILSFGFCSQSVICVFIDLLVRFL